MRGRRGAPRAREAARGTILGDDGLVFSDNLVQGSDSAESAATELDIFFGGQTIEGERSDLEWRYSVKEELA